MAYRNGNYVAFDGLGQADPTKSDFRYYATIQSWASGRNLDFKFTNSHERTAAVRDTSLKSTLESRIRERLALSKNVIVILSAQTRKSGSMLSYEVEKAVDYYSLPLICLYTGYYKVCDPSALRALWPSSLEQRINSGAARVIHSPFKKNALLYAMNNFTVHSSSLTGSLHYFTIEAHQEFGCFE